jgi:hypothetical protein
MVRLLLQDCQNLAMPGLVAGLLVRYEALTGDLLDGWLARPEIWRLEAARAASEGRQHVQGPDPDDLTGKDRRRFSFREVAADMTLRAVLDADQDRLAGLAVIADDLIRHGRELLTDGQDVGQHMATIQGWAAIFRPENYHARQSENGIAIEYQPPEDVAKNLAPHRESLDRVSTAFRLETTYTMALSEDRTIPTDTLAEDLAAARDLADNPPQDGPVQIIEPVTAVAAAAVVAHSQQRIKIAPEELNWCAGILVEVATDQSRHPADSEYSRYLMGADRSAAGALPALLLLPPDPTGPDPETIDAALRHCATSLPDQVRLIFAQATSMIWTAACRPTTAASPCRHQQLWDACMEGLRDCQLGGWSPTAQQRLISPIQQPFEEALAAIPTDRLLLNRLIAPLVAAAAAASSRSCVAQTASAMLRALLPALRRSTLHWAEEQYSHPGNQHGPAAARALAELAASGSTEPLTEHVRALTGNMNALATFLHDLAIEFTYNHVLMPSLTSTWRPLMDAALSEIERDPGLLDDDHHWTEVALGSLVPGPDLRLEDTNPDATLRQAQQTWVSPDEFADLISRWIPIARGRSGATDGLVRLARCGTPRWQATTALAWTEDQIAGRYWAIARRFSLFPTWLSEIRPHLQQDPEVARWRRIVDGLAAAGDSRAARMQQAEE